MLSSSNKYKLQQNFRDDKKLEQNNLKNYIIYYKSATYSYISMTSMAEIDVNRNWYELSPDKKIQIPMPFLSPNSLPIFPNLLLSIISLPPLLSFLSSFFY